MKWASVVVLFVINLGIAVKKLIFRYLCKSLNINDM